MKKLIILAIVATIFLAGCGSKNNGQLFGVQDRPDWYQQDPYGMLFIPQGSFQMGPNDQDVTSAMTAQSKTVTLQSFFMDETEITNNEYRQFVNYVRDSIARRTMGAVNEEFFVTTTEDGQEIDPPALNWRTKLKWDEEEAREALKDMFLPDNERFYRKKEIDSRKLNFEYYWIDLKTAAMRSNREQGKKSRDVFIKKDIVNVYPDTLAWIHDYTYSYNEPMTNMYFWHPAYDNYPVVGVNWKQVRAFSIWRTQLLNNYLNSIGLAYVQDFRLPTETEWEYASRGGLSVSPYPWGGPYIRNIKGCFLGNYKPLRGDYSDDGGVLSIIVAHYHPNGYGLYDMAGNVAEWTSNAFDESAYSFIHDLNPDYVYDAKETDPAVLKRKVIRGGSWKDVGMYLQVSTRTYEYQDTSKCYIGFRNVMSYLGRDKADLSSGSKIY